MRLSYPQHSQELQSKAPPMKYINKKTGAIIDVAGKVSSDLWELAEKPAPISVDKNSDEKKAPKKKAEK